MSLNVYPVQATGEKCENYRVKINGEYVELNTARVSAYPFNRRWPGHQRRIEQTELINFLSFACDGTTVIEIYPQLPFEGCTIRPLSSGITPEMTSDGSIVIILEKPMYFTVEPYGRSGALHVFADPMPQYNSIDKDDNNIIYFGAGEHDVGMLNLESNQTVFIDEGAVVYGCIHAYEASNIKILGRGILDNSKNKEEILFEVEADGNTADVGNSIRTHTVQLEYCSDIVIEGITIRDSLVYNIRPICCKNINISNVKIIGCWRYNSDGIDMHNCENVHINNCFMRTFDDCLCVKGFDYTQNEADMYHNGINYDVFKGIVVENCVLWNDWGKCLEIGAEARAKEICDIVFRNCNIIHVCGCVLDCLNVDYADIHDVLYENITVEYDDVIPCPTIQYSDKDTYINNSKDYAPPLIYAGIIYHEEYSKRDSKRGLIRNIVFKNISLFGRQSPYMGFDGYNSEYQCSNIEITGLTHNGNKVVDCMRTNSFCHNIVIKE